MTTTFATSAAGSGRESNTVQGTDFSDEEFDKLLSEPDTGRGGQERIEKEQESREYPNGTEEDYRSLLELKTADYQSRSVADFNMDLLEWANESYERMERINIDIAQQDFSVNLDSDELSFVALTTWLSGVENGKYVQSINTGRKEEDPGCIFRQKQRKKTDTTPGAIYSISFPIISRTRRRLLSGNVTIVSAV